MDTIGKLAEEIITEYYKKFRNDNANYTIRHIAEQVAIEMAFFAKANAYENDKLGECTFSNDQFIATYNNLSLSTDTNGVKYVSFPNAPAGLPQGREIAAVQFVGNKKIQVIPMRNKDRFMQSFTNTPKWMVLCYVEDGKLMFDNLATNVTANVNLKLVGAIPQGTELVDLPLNVPKDTQSLIFDKVLSRMYGQRNILPDQINDNVSR